MAPKYLTLILFLWITGALMGGLIDGQLMGDVDCVPTEDNPLTGADETVICAQVLMDGLYVWQNIDMTDVSGGFHVIGAGGDFFTTIFTILAFDFAFLEAEGDAGTYLDIFRWVVLGPILIAVIWGLIVTLVGVFSRVFTFGT